MHSERSQSAFAIIGTLWRQHSPAPSSSKCSASLFSVQTIWWKIWRRQRLKMMENLTQKSKCDLPRADDELQLFRLLFSGNVSKQEGWTVRWNVCHIRISRLTVLECWMNFCNCFCVRLVENSQHVVSLPKTFCYCWVNMSLTAFCTTHNEKMFLLGFVYCKNFQ